MPKLAISTGGVEMSEKRRRRESASRGGGQGAGRGRDGGGVREPLPVRPSLPLLPPRHCFNRGRIQASVWNTA